MSSSATELTIDVRRGEMGALGARRFVQDIWLARQPDRVVARSRTVVVLVNDATGSKVRVSDDVRRTLGFPPG